MCTDMYVHLLPIPLVLGLQEITNYSDINLYSLLSIPVGIIK